VRNTRIAITSAAVAVLVVAVSVNAPASEAATRTRISAKPSLTRPVVHELVTVRGTASSHFKRVVALQYRTGSHWKTLKHGRTGSHGTYRFTLGMSSAHKWSVLTPAARHSGHHYAAARTRSFTVRPVPQAVRLQVLPGVVQQGTTPAASSAAQSAVVAQFSPARPGRLVAFKLQQADGSWSVVHTAKEHADGTAYYFGATQSASRTLRFAATALSRSGAAAVSSTPASVDVTAPFGDEFSGTSLDTSKWTYRVGSAPSRTKSVNDARAISEAAGTLRLQVQTPPPGTSKLLNGQVSYKQLMQPYGVAAARIKFPAGRGQHGSFWLQSPTFYAAPGDPKASGGEIDTVEFFGKGYPGGGLANFTYHADESRALVKTGGVWPQATGLIGKSDAWWASYHVFSVRWTPTSYTFYVDGQQLWTTTEAVSGQPEELILSLLTSDWEIPDLDRSALPSTMYVDWMKAWQTVG
jgi:beta-glucanase (GH16 family)